MLGGRLKLEKIKRAGEGGKNLRGQVKERQRVAEGVSYSSARLRERDFWNEGGGIGRTHHDSSRGNRKFGFLKKELRKYLLRKKEDEVGGRKAGVSATRGEIIRKFCNARKLRKESEERRIVERACEKVGGTVSDKGMWWAV